MLVETLQENGYDSAALGLSMNYNTSESKAKNTMKNLAHKDLGHNKCLESICVWLNIVAPIYFWSEFDTFRIGVTKQSQSTMHTFLKKEVTEYEYVFDSVDQKDIDTLTKIVNKYIKRKNLRGAKQVNPAGFEQRRVVCLNYKVLRNIIMQRRDHKLDEWQYFCKEIYEQAEHSELLPHWDKEKADLLDLTPVELVKKIRILEDCLYS